MKRYFMLLFALLTVVLSSVTSSAYGGVINIVCEEGEAPDNEDEDNDNKREEFPHLMPRHYSSLAIGFWSQMTGILRIEFNCETEDVAVKIYKCGVLLVESFLSVSFGESVSFFLPPYEKEEYQIFIYGTSDVLYGSFQS